MIEKIDLVPASMHHNHAHVDPWFFARKINEIVEVINDRIETVNILADIPEVRVPSTCKLCALAVGCKFEHNSEQCWHKHVTFHFA